MKKRMQGLLVGILIGVLITGGIPAFAATQNLSALYNNIKLIIDGKEITPKDANGATVEPFIVNGTTYLPVRAVANALGKEVYWDGPNYTVYIGAMGGALEYPTLKMEDAVNVGDGWSKANNDELVDNYGNRYPSALRGRRTFETLLNMKYSKFKATVYVKNGLSSDYTASFVIEADGKQIYASPEITKTSSPIQLDIDIRGCNDFKIIAKGGVYDDIGSWAAFGNAGFYQ